MVNYSENLDRKQSISTSEDQNKQVALLSKSYALNRFDDYDDEDEHAIKITSQEYTPIDFIWCQKILGLVKNKAKLMESFSWLSTVGGGFSALGERDDRFSMRAGALSLGQQLQLAELLGDDRLKVMCHLFAALAGLQLENKQFCVNYIRRVIIPQMNKLPYRDPILMNILRHICFRLRDLEKLERFYNAIEDK